MRTTLTTAAVLSAALLLAPLTGTTPPAHAATAAKSERARVIVKYKADSPLLRRQVQSAGAREADRAAALGQRTGLALRTGRAVTERSQVIHASGIASADLARRLAREADVEYAVPDQRRRALAVPNDPLYPAGPAIVEQQGGPASGQWYLRAPTSERKSAINAEAAWDVATGTPGLVVAVLDTGVRFDHPDLKTVAQGGSLLAGYDMLGADDGDASGTFLIANDGNGRDADASDPGDWITEAEANDEDGEFYQCTSLDADGRYVAEDSSWHGTQVAGVIGALTDNAVGMASVARGVRVLPVRVLGKCGGFDSDIAAGMLWAAGIAVPGVPANATPAKVLNLSLGGEGSCDALYEDTVEQIVARGSVVVASAGNDEGHAVNAPANCPGVIAVAALRHAGSKVGFSDIGPEVSLSAPGGNCVTVEPGDACQYPILTTTNTGVTRPVSNTTGGSTYSDAFNATIGTSFSAPLVAGSAALMLVVQPELTPAEVRTKLRASARAFPTSGAGNGTDGEPVPMCTAPRQDGNGDWIDQDQCYCTTSTCGAGMLDTAGAVLAADGVQARIDVVTASPTPGVAVSVSAAPSLLNPGHSIVSYAWSIADAGGGIVGTYTGATDGATAFITPTAAGTFRVRLTAVDNAGISSTATRSITVTGAPVVVPTPTPSDNGGGGGGGALGAGWLALLLAAVLGLGFSARRER